MSVTHLPSTQRALRETLRSGFDALDARLRASSALLPPDRWGVRRPDGGWSVGEILEHCCLSNEIYLAPMRAALLRAGAPHTDARDFTWRPTLMGGLLHWTLGKSFKTPAPGPIKPGPVPRPHVLEALMATHAALRTLMDEAIAHDWRAVRFVSPLSPLVRPNLGDAFAICLRHGERHAGQLERTVALVG